MTQWLFDTALYTGLLIAAVLLLRRPVARLFGPQIAYALWALPFLRMLLPPVVLPSNFAPEQDPRPAAETIGIAAPGIPSHSEPLSVSEALLSASWSDILVPLWLAGALAFLLWRIVTYRRMRSDVLAHARPVGEVGPIRLVETPAVGAPVAFGVVDKVIALPPLFMAQQDRVGRDLAIAHELAHHRANDLLANFAAQALLALHWCNPLAWLGWRAMRRDQEAACDARVMAGHGRADRARYAALIAGIAAGPRLALAAPMACPMLGEASIVHRLRTLSQGDFSPRRRRIGRALLGFGALALPLTASVSYAAVSEAESTLPLLPAPPEPPMPVQALPALPPNPVEPPAVPGAPDAAPAADLPSLPDPAAAAAYAERMQHFAARMDRMAERHTKESERLARVAERDAERAAREAERAGLEAERMGREAERLGREVERAVERGVAAQAASLRSSASTAAGTEAMLRACGGDEFSTARDRASMEAQCEKYALAVAREALMTARSSIAADSQMPEAVRREVLRDLDREIAEIRRSS